MACRAEPERKWRGVVAAQVEKMQTVVDRPSQFDGVTKEQAARQAFLRLAEAASLPGPWYGYAPELVPGVVELVALDLPDAVVFFSDDNVEALGGHEALRRAGLENLRGVLREVEHQQLRLKNGAELDVLVGESLFTASLALVLPEVLEALHPGSSDSPLGVFVAMPHRGTLALHVLRGGSAVRAINALASFAASGYRESAGALSPHLYWWQEGRWEQVTKIDGDTIELEVSDDLDEALTLATERDS